MLRKGGGNLFLIFWGGDVGNCDKINIKMKFI